MFRRPAVAGTWYPANETTLAHEVDDFLARAPSAPFGASAIRAVIAPHAGLVYSGAVAGAAYAATRGGEYDVIVVVGPSHYVAFEGVAAWPAGAFGTPFGEMRVLDADVARLVECSTVISIRTDAHAREHSLEMQLPFLARLFPDTPIVPLVMGEQTSDTIEALARVLVEVYRGRHLLLVASSDLSHFFDAPTADVLDARVARHVGAFDADGLWKEMERYPLYERGRFVMCGGGPVVAVMHAARGLGAARAAVLSRSHSGVISGDNDRVVGYLAAAFGLAPHAQ